MKIQKRNYFIAMIISFFITILAIYETDGWVRSYLTDFTSAIYLFFLLKVIFNKKKIVYCMIIFIFICVEANQYFNFLSFKNNFIQKVFIGGTFDLCDFIFYGLGFFFALAIEEFISKKIKQVY